MEELEIVASLDNLANDLQEKGLIHLATELDKVSNTIESIASSGPRGNFVFPPDSSDVNDDKGHYPLTSKDQAHSALSYSAAEANSSPSGKPSWSNTLTNKQVEERVRGKVKKEFPSIELSDK